MRRIGFLIIGLFLFILNSAWADSYSLQEYLALVKQHSKNLRLAEKEKEMAKVNKKQAISTALPKVGLQADYTRNLTEYYMYADFGKLSAMFGGDMNETAKFKVKRNNEYSANVAIQQTLFSPTVGSAIKAANQFQKLTDYAYNASEQSILAAAKKMYYQALLLKEFWHVSEATEQNAKDNYANMKLKFDNGVVSEFELLQAEVRWKDAIPRAAESKRNYQLALNNLKNWAGIPVQEEILLDGSFSSYPEMPKEFALDKILHNRPDFNALLWEEKLRRTNVGAKKAAYLPTLTGTAAYAYSAQSDAFKLEQENNFLFAGVHLSVPIFTGGYNSSEVQKAQIELEKARVKIEQTKENIYNETTNIYLRLQEAHERITSAEATLRAAQKAFQIAETTAQNGLATQLQLKDARVGFDRAQMNYFAAIFDYLSAYFDWERATGKGEVF